MTKQKQVLRFEPKEEAEIIKRVSKVLTRDIDNPITEEKAVKMSFFGILDTANVCMVIAKSEQAKRVLSRFKDSEDREEKEPKLDYNVKKELVTSRYSYDYLKPILNLMTYISDNNQFSLRNDYPLSIDNDHFKIILAPRVEND